MSELKKITPNEYQQLTQGKELIFCSQEFLELNKDKVDSIHYLLYKEKKNRLAFAIGEKNKEWKAPFSAPFATTIELQKQVQLKYYWNFVELLNEYAIKKNIRNINIFLPPNAYHSRENSKLTNALLGNGYQINYIDLNFSLNLTNINQNNYINFISSAAKKNLNIALKSDLTFIKCISLESIKEAYQIIQINRIHKGYPLRMSLQEVLNTIKIIKSDCFLVKKDNLSIAAAIMFYTSTKTVQLIYWGNIPDIEKYKPMNFLAYELIKYYKLKDIQFLDLGPSSENGIPSYGLCSFKENIGCEISEKYRFHKQF